MDIFSPVELGDIRLKNRIVMAPMTRSRAGADALPTDIMVDYYHRGHCTQCRWPGLLPHTRDL